MPNANPPDFAALVQLSVVFIAMVGAAWVGWLKRGPRKFGRVLISVALTLIWGFAFTFFAVVANEVCRTSLHLCSERGDGNMTYWFLPFFAMPVYLVLMLIFGTRSEPLVLAASPFDAAVNQALAQLRRHARIAQRCPACQSLITREAVTLATNDVNQRFYLRCACGKCDRLFDQRLDH